MASAQSTSASVGAVSGLDAAIAEHAQFLDKLTALETALLTRDASMPKHLGEIHRQLITHEELVHLLSDAQIGQIMAAQQAHTNVILAQPEQKAKAKKSALAKSAGLGLDDL